MIKFSTDSTCDLPKHILEEYDIAVIPLVVTLGDKEYLDGINISPDDIFDFVKQYGELPKTAGRSIEDFKEYFLKLLEKSETVVHCGIGSKLSVCYQNACLAAQEIGEDKVKVIDSKSLSTGTGLILMRGVETYKNGGKLSDIEKSMIYASDRAQASFMVDKLDFLYKGGRCSKFSFSVANMLRIKPRLEVIDGKLVNTGKEIGPLKSVLIKYVDAILKKYNRPNKDICFVTHTKMDDDIINSIVEYVESKHIFDKVESTFAGSVITSHCGEGTLGILFLNDAEQ